MPNLAMQTKQCFFFTHERRPTATSMSPHNRTTIYDSKVRQTNLKPTVSKSSSKKIIIIYDQ